MLLCVAWVGYCFQSDGTATAEQGLKDIYLKHKPKIVHGHAGPCMQAQTVNRGNTNNM